MKTGAETEQAATSPRLPAAPRAEAAGRSLPWTCQGQRRPVTPCSGPADPRPVLRNFVLVSALCPPCATGNQHGAAPWDPSSPAPLPHPPSDQAATAAG